MRHGNRATYAVLHVWRVALAAGMALRGCAVQTEEGTELADSLVVEQALFAFGATYNIGAGLAVAHTRGTARQSVYKEEGLAS